MVVLEAQWKTISPCRDGRAAELAKVDATDTEPTHWVAIDRIQSAEDAFSAALQVGASEPAVLVGAPAAVGRLRYERGLIDKLLLSMSRSLQGRDGTAARAAGDNPASPAAAAEGAAASSSSR